MSVPAIDTLPYYDWKRKVIAFINCNTLLVLYQLEIIIIII